MSYCTLDEAWGVPSKCSRTNNSSGKKNGVSYKIKNELPCNKPTPFANDPIEDDNIYYLPKNERNERNERNNNNSQQTNYNLVNQNNKNSFNSLNTNCDKFSYLDENTNDECNMFSDYPRDGNVRQPNNNNNVNPENLDIINSKNFNDGPQPLNPYNDKYGNIDYLNNNDDNDDDNDYSNELVIQEENNNKYTRINQPKMSDLVEPETLDLVRTEEGFENNNNNNVNNNQTIQDTQKMLLNILDRLDVLETKINNTRNKKNNVHDIILFIVIGIFVLFALDSVFRIGRLTV
jgi:hypothetical protein